MSADPLQDILDSAQQHGEDSEPDHEVGDLQAALTLCWEYLSKRNKALVHKRFFEEVADQA